MHFRLDAPNLDGFVKSPISALCEISQNFTYAKYSVFFEIWKALILSRLGVITLPSKSDFLRDCLSLQAPKIKTGGRGVEIRGRECSCSNSFPASQSEAVVIMHKYAVI